ncbi:uncharacterized protein [Venturia canescens]|uniref:uncharacterized protein n=1 Tax=Venturia canescens TaxID=32260 RepID=UPI001C9C968A|nr:uncharacterized protein LOC122415016 [Venturia canescens]
MENENGENVERFVTLVLGEDRFQANKRKLVDYSLYFASLFSENFNDHLQNEFKINYDITSRTLKHFLNWINHEEDHARVVYSQKYLFFARVSLEYFLGDHYSELMDLLELSVVFMAERLTEQIIEMIICMRYSPDDMLEVWLLAENLGLKVLRDVALATCLDRFDELSSLLLVKLPAENFLKLLLNVNVRSSTENLQQALEKWKMHNDIPKDLPDAFLRFVNGDPDFVRLVLQQKKKSYVQCITGRKEDGSFGIWSWNGQNFCEMAEMTKAQIHTMLEDNGREMVGFQVIGRGFNIYFVGGEQGLGSGRYNITVWRYCPFSKKWYILTELRRKRRHMAVAFIENKLYLFGGVGHHRCKVLTVDIFDVHTEKWSDGQRIPHEFTRLPTSCVLKKHKFIYFYSHYYIYDPSRNHWSQFFVSEDEIIWPHSLIEDRDISIIGSSRNKKKDGLKTYCVITTEYENGVKAQMDTTNPPASAFIHISPSFETDGEWEFDQQFMPKWPHIISFGHSKKKVVIEVAELIRTLDDDKPIVKYLPLKVYSTTLQSITDRGFNERLGLTNLLNPECLHKILPVPEQASISV